MTDLVQGDAQRVPSAPPHTPWLQVWQALLSVRALVLPPSQDVHTYLKFSSLCRKSGRVRFVLFVWHATRARTRVQTCFLPPLCYPVICTSLVVSLLRR